MANEEKRKEYLQKVKNIMTNPRKNPYIRYHEQNFSTFNYGEMTPINSDIIVNMPNARIILSEKVHESLLATKDVTVLKNVEIPFFLCGDEAYNEIIFNECIIDENILSGVNSQTEANFSNEMLNRLQEKIEKNTIEENTNNEYKFVVCHGHSHPPIGDFYQNFSLGDFTSYIEMNQENPVFNDKKVELVGCVVTADEDINFVFYDNIKNNFYRFLDVFVLDKENNYSRVNCYGQSQAKRYNI